MGKNYQLLDQFKGMECAIFSRPLDNDAVDNKYVIKSFDYELDEFYLHLKDVTNNRIEATIRFDEIADIFNLGDDVDVYEDLVKIRTNYHTTYYIHTLEKKPLLLTCDKCGYEFEEYDPIWNINQQGQYGSMFDGDWICKRLCDDCVSGFIN